MFQIGDKIVHPMHGAGVIDEIVTRKTDGVARDYYSLRLLVSGIRVMLPVETCRGLEVRPVLSPQAMEAALEQIAQVQVTMTANWNHRYRENLERLKSGRLLEVAKVAKGLMARERASRGLSNGERRMLQSAKEILTSELALSQSIPYDRAAERMRGALGAYTTDTEETT